jgi:serine/threonine protein phosphatase PrpC
VIEAHGLSDRGPVRKSNEDCFVSDPALRLFVVADGMGGHSAGEVASNLAAETIEGFIRRTDEDAEFSWPYGIEPGLSFSGNRLRTAVHLANRRIFRAAERYDEYTGMGTTAVGALISGQRMAVANAGDSRLYLFSGGCLTQLTRDDTWAATVLASQAGTNAPAPPESMRRVLTNVLGAREQADVRMSEHDLTAGDEILLCSDGLHSVLDDPAIASVLSAGGTVSEVVSRLIKEALSRGARDNITAVLARYAGE